MPTASPASTEDATSIDHVDVLIVGAGLSGIGIAHHLQDQHPNRTYAIVEARDAIGGTWDLFRYPGIRSDSDMHTLGYRFRPWIDEKSIADGPTILQYIRDTATEAGIDKHIHYNLKVVRAEWSNDNASWTIEMVNKVTGKTVYATSNVLLSCSGYYDYDQGFTPDFAGTEDFRGQIIHPQFWPEDLDYKNKKVVIIGSGATAVTLLPAMAEEAAHVTMLQRTPSYVMTVPERDPIANTLRKILGENISYPITRWKNVALQTLVFQLSQRQPRIAKKLIRVMLERQLPKGYDIDTHFNPPYDPWDQRLCAVPDGDLFKSIRKGDASIVTDRIETFTENGIKLVSGKELEADIIITATGLSLIPIGGVQFAVDGEDIELRDKMAYKGMMLSDLPNFAFTIGYTNSSWTLKADLVSDYVCRTLRFMDAHGYNKFVPVNTDPTVTQKPLLDFPAGYVLRAIESFPKAGSKKPWRLGMNYAQDVVTLRHGSIEDGTMQFSTLKPAAVAEAVA